MKKTIFWALMDFSIFWINIIAAVIAIFERDWIIMIFFFFSCIVIFFKNMEDE